MNKPQLLEGQTAHYFSVTSIDFAKCYKVMDMREKRGYSDRDLSFLLGFQPLFVRDAENPLNKKRYKAKDTNYLLHILDCELPDIMDGILPETIYKLSVIATVHDNGTKSYAIYKEQRNGKNKLYRSFAELAANELLVPKSVARPGEVKQHLVDLLSSDYFAEPRTGLEIFRECTAYFGGHLKPTFIGEAIKEINKEAGPKIKIGKNRMRRWIYNIEK